MTPIDPLSAHESTATDGLSAADEARAAELADRLFASLVPGLTLLTIELGRRLGLYQSMHDTGDVTAAQLAESASIHPRYALEWLEQQATAGIIAVAFDAGVAETRRYAIPAAHVPVLLTTESPLHLMGAATMFTGVATAFDAVVAAYRGGSPVSFSDFGEGVRHGLEIFNRATYANDLRGWMQQLPAIAAQLEAGGLIVDAGCGTGWSTVALAKAFPHATVVGIDLDEASIRDAVQHAREANVDDRVSFVVADAGDARSLRDAIPERARLVTIFEALHDMLDPHRALTSLGSLLAEGGAIFIADEKVSAEFTAPSDSLDQLNYAFSVLHCLPATMAEGQGIANGTVLRASTVRAWASQAGLSGFEQLEIEHDLWSFYRLTP